jgi:hypothetical protein
MEDDIKIDLKETGWIGVIGYIQLRKEARGGLWRIRT